MKFLLRGVFVMGAAMGLRSLLAAKKDDDGPAERDHGVDKPAPTGASDAPTTNGPPPGSGIYQDTH